MADNEYGWDGGDDLPLDDEAHGVRGRVEGILRDVLKRTASQSAGAKQVTEDVLKAVVNDMKLPRDVASFMLNNADSLKNEISRVIATELRRFLETANVGDELARILTSISFEVRTEVRFIPNDEAIRPSVRSHVGIKSTRTDEVLNEGDSNVLDRAVNAGVTEFLGRLMKAVPNGDGKSSRREGRGTGPIARVMRSTMPVDRPAPSAASAPRPASSTAPSSPSATPKQSETRDAEDAYEESVAERRARLKRALARRKS